MTTCLLSYTSNQLLLKEKYRNANINNINVKFKQLITYLTLLGIRCSNQRSAHGCK